MILVHFLTSSPLVGDVGSGVKSSLKICFDQYRLKTRNLRSYQLRCFLSELIICFAITRVVKVVKYRFVSDNVSNMLVYSLKRVQIKLLSIRQLTSHSEGTGISQHCQSIFSFSFFDSLD